MATVRSRCDPAGCEAMFFNGTLHHVGLASRNALAESEEWQRTFGLAVVSDLVHDPVQDVRVLFLSDGTSGTLIELVEPASDQSTVGAFLKTTNRFYHVCYEVDDLDGAVREVRARGALIIQDPVPAAAFGGRRIAWCYTRTGNLVELLERSSPQSP